jgi:ferrous iron transport protein B
MRFALIGQPNCGKSTLFNQVAGYKAETGNFSGTTVSFKETKVRVVGSVIELVDLPGTYSLLGTNPAERVVLDYLTSKEVDAVINVIDATHLVQGLLFTLELLDIGRPMVLAINMMDDAVRQGLKIDGEKLSRLLGIPVLPMIASRGQGVRETFIQALKLAKEKKISKPQKYGTEIEAAINGIKPKLKKYGFPISRRAIAVKLLEGDPEITKIVTGKTPDIAENIHRHLDSLCHSSFKQAVWMITSERQNNARELAKSVSHQGASQLSFRDKLDDYLLHPIFGYIFLLLILAAFFGLVYGIGNWIEGPLLAFFENLTEFILSRMAVDGLVPQLIAGIIQGISGGLAIVLPYLLPFLMGLGFLEDIGYLTRIAFLTDALMHKMGLHGKAVVPFILGYGCTVPAIMSTRIMEDKRDRILSAALVTMIPCAARLSVIFGLVSFYLGPWAALGIYFFNLLVIAITGRIITRFLPEDSPGLILEMPVYRMPTLRSVSSKAWFRIREFIFEAWPLLIIGSVVLAALNYYSVTPYLDKIFQPITWALGLPSTVGTPLLFGIFRKELSLVMLAQALGTSDFGSALTAEQMMVYTIFVIFYIPCISTIVTIKNELGTKNMWLITGLSLFVATITALLTRLAAVILA